MEAKPIPVRLSPELIAWLDEQADRRAISRSAFIRKCLERVKSASG